MSAFVFVSSFNSLKVLLTESILETCSVILLHISFTDKISELNELTKTNADIANQTDEIANTVHTNAKTIFEVVSKGKFQ